MGWVVLMAEGRWALVVAVKSTELGEYGTIDCSAGRKWLPEGSSDSKRYGKDLVLGFKGQN